MTKLPPNEVPCPQCQGPCEKTPSRIPAHANFRSLVAEKMAVVEKEREQWRSSCEYWQMIADSRIDPARTKAVIEAARTALTTCESVGEIKFRTNALADGAADKLLELRKRFATLDAQENDG